MLVSQGHVAFVSVNNAILDLDLAMRALANGHLIRRVDERLLVVLFLVYDKNT